MPRTADCAAVDLDGTVLQCSQRQCTVVADLLSEFGAAALDERAFWRAKRGGATTMTALERLGYGPDAVGHVADRWLVRIENTQALALDAPFPGAGRALGVLRNRFPRLVLVTARQRPDGVRDQLAKFGLEAYFDRVEVVDPRDSVEGKRQVFVRIRAALVIGDSEVDLEAAHGRRFVAVSGGQRTRGFLLRAGAREVYGSILGAAVAIVGGPPAPRPHGAT